MENLKQVSCKLDPKTLQKMEKFLKHHPYWKRNTLINCILTAVVDGFEDRAIFDMCQYSRYYLHKCSGTFTLDAGYLKNQQSHEQSE